MPSLLPNSRCALTAPFHIYLFVSRFGLLTSAMKPAQGCVALLRSIPIAQTGILLSVALSVGSLRAGVTRHLCFRKPRLSSM